MINVLIVEDDPMVAEFNKRYLSKVDGFQVIEIVHSVDEAAKVMEREDIQLMLLDVYMPGKNGIELLSMVREKNLPIDVILITAASDVDKIQSALHYGAVDYLIKPFEFTRFKQALLRYKEKSEVLKQKENLDQKELDQTLWSTDKEKMKEPKALPKGLTKSTLLIIMDTIKEKKSFSTDEISEITNISRVSVRKYLMFLVEIEVLEETLVYGIGRPVYRYSYQGNTEALDPYLT
ncbi:response regulator [Gracilibacillus sp. YIM 98692]|uniref:response regulator n=1 Tax=Gracilibacillus sp. YIM 98692 TaxID=2663532 RepID=UPI0013D7E3C9|nr:response regulator [Gracilibacillus sp. YIM 98692]